jgi:hypothetical protein
MRGCRIGEDGGRVDQDEVAVLGQLAYDGLRVGGARQIRRVARAGAGEHEGQPVHVGRAHELPCRCLLLAGLNEAGRLRVFSIVNEAAESASTAGCLDLRGAVSEVQARNDLPSFSMADVTSRVETAPVHGPPYSQGPIGIRIAHSWGCTPSGCAAGLFPWRMTHYPSGFPQLYVSPHSTWKVGGVLGAEVASRDLARDRVRSMARARLRS